MSERDASPASAGVMVIPERLDEMPRCVLRVIEDLAAASGSGWAADTDIVFAAAVRYDIPPDMGAQVLEALAAAGVLERKRSSRRLSTK